MRAAFQISKSLVLGLLRLGIAYVLFFYLAHFTEVQSIVLAIVGLCAIDGYRLAFKIAAKQQPGFEPFRVRIRPNWYSICHDFDLAAGEKWEELRQKCESAPAKYTIFQQGFSFTMLSPTLFYSNDQQYFFGELDFHIPVEELKPDPDGYFAPQFCIKRSLTGEKKNVPVIELGLVTQDPLANIFQPLNDKLEMPLAKLPWIVFYGYFHPDEYDYDRLNKIGEQTKAQLAEFGWTEKEQDVEDSRFHFPYEVNHKYFAITYRGLS